MFHIIMTLFLSTEAKYSLLLFLFLKYFTWFIKLLWPLREMNNLEFSIFIISMMYSFLFGEAKWILLKDLNISNMSLNPLYYSYCLWLFFWILNLDLKKKISSLIFLKFLTYIKKNDLKFNHCKNYLIKSIILIILI